MKALSVFLINVACVIPVVTSLDARSPLVFLAWGTLALLVSAPRRAVLMTAALAGSALLGWWVFVMNALWTVGPGAGQRALDLAVRASVLAALGASFVLSVRFADLVNEAMQVLRLPVRWGWALYVAWNTLPRVREEQRLIRAVHRARLRGRSSGLLVQAVTLLAGAIRSAERAALALEVRGFESPAPRTWYRYVDWTPRDTIGTGAFVVGVVVTWVALLATGVYRWGSY